MKHMKRLGKEQGLQSPPMWTRKWLACGLVKFAPAVAYQTGRNFTKLRPSHFCTPSTCTHSPSNRIKGGLNRSTFSSPAAASSSSALVSGGSSRGGRTPSFPKSLPLPLRHPSPQGCISIMRQYTDKQITAGHTTLPAEATIT